jgi:hypothetical protein
MKTNLKVGFNSKKDTVMFQVKGRYLKDDTGEPQYIVAIAELGIYTTEETPEKCLKKVKDVIEMISETPGFAVTITPLENQEFLVSSNNCQLLQYIADDWAEFSRRFREEAHSTLLSDT